METLEAQGPEQGPHLPVSKSSTLISSHCQSYSIFFAMYTTMATFVHLFLNSSLSVSIFRMEITKIRA